VLLAVVVLLAAGVLIGALFLPRVSLPTVAPSVAPARVVQVTSQLYDGARQVSATPIIDQAATLRAGLAGVVTASGCTAGANLSSGGSGWMVDGQPLLSLATTEPLWRDLTPGLKGSDVTALQNELTRLGHPVNSSGVYDWATRQATSDLLKTVGATPHSDGTLPLAWIVWLPSSEIEIASCQLATGDPVMAGDVVAKATGALRGLRVANPPGEGWLARYGDASSPLDAGGLASDPTFLAAVEAGPDYAALPQDQPGTIAVTVALAQARAVLVVPPSAVLVSGQGKGCVISQDETKIPVDIVASSLGQTMVALTADVTAISAVLMAPDTNQAC
jgi:hypothetical protein